MKKNPKLRRDASFDPSGPEPGLAFPGGIPMASRRLAGLGRDHFANGRLFATVSPNGGLLNIAYWGNQHLDAAEFFHGDPGTSWIKLFRPCVGLEKKRYYLTLNQTKLFPFGWQSRDEVRGVKFEHELLLLPDALVQRFRVERNSQRLPVFIEMFHQECFTVTNAKGRTWSDFEFDSKNNAIITSCVDENRGVYDGGDQLAQSGIKLGLREAPRATTWIGLGCSTRMKVRFAHARTKIYLTSKPLRNRNVSFFLVFATTRRKLQQRLAQLSQTVHRECDQLLAGHEKRLKSRPRIDVGHPVLNSAFSQFPEVIHHLKLPDRPGATRATAAGYWVWGWDAQTPAISSTLANEPDFTASILKFLQETRHQQYGIPHAYTTAFQLKYKGPLPSQAQFIASLYHYVSTTGDVAIVRKMWPTCRWILDRCRENKVKQTGLVSGYALWPDFPEAMEENGHDISSLNNSLLYQGLRAMEYLAGLVGDKALSRECREWARQQRADFVKYLYDPKQGYFISSCSSRDFKPRKHYCCQAVFWVTPFARELVSHATARIASFMNEHLRSAKCLLSLPTWDTAWMNDGNQLGSSFPAADYFYLNVNKLVGDGQAVRAWLGDVEWFWKYHTAPEAFTPETENEHLLGPDNTGCKQTQALSTWYACLYMGVAGLDFDHEGITITPWGDTPVDITGLRLRGSLIAIKIRGHGRHIGSLKWNGKLLAPGCHKIGWDKLRGKSNSLELVRSEKAPKHPVIVRADGLRVSRVECRAGYLKVRVVGEMAGEIVAHADARAQIQIDGKHIKATFDQATATFSIPCEPGNKITLEVRSQQSKP